MRGGLLEEPEYGKHMEDMMTSHDTGTTRVVAVELTSCFVKDAMVNSGPCPPRSDDFRLCTYIDLFSSTHATERESYATVPSCFCFHHQWCRARRRQASMDCPSLMGLLRMSLPNRTKLQAWKVHFNTVFDPAGPMYIAYTAWRHLHDAVSDVPASFHCRRLRARRLAVFAQRPAWINAVDRPHLLICPWFQRQHVIMRIDILLYYCINILNI